MRYTRRLAVAGALAMTALTIGGQAATSADPGATTGASIGNRVWVDANANGRIDAGEGGLAGVTVRLRYDNGRPFIVGRTAADGWWGIGGLQTGRCYLLSFDLEPGYSASPIVDDGNVMGADGSAGRICITADHRTDLNAGFVPPAAPGEPGTGTGKIGNRVFLDTNADGVWGGYSLGPDGESVFTVDPGAPGVGIELRDRNGVPRVRGVTDAEGYYGFEGLPVGCYQVAVTPPAGLRLIGKDRGFNDIVDSDADASGVTDPICLTRAGEVQDDWDIGLTDRPARGPVPHIRAHLAVWNDLDGDGVRDPDEPPITDVDGYYSEVGGRFSDYSFPPFGADGSVDLEFDFVGWEAPEASCNQLLLGLTRQGPQWVRTTPLPDGASAPAGNFTYATVLLCPTAPPFAATWRALNTDGPTDVTLDIGLRDIGRPVS
ncbi:MAG: SdrD B-like domain-containing protein [Acidimicrobiales bacterium]